MPAAQTAGAALRPRRSAGRRAGAESPDKPEPAAGASVRLLPRQEADEDQHSHSLECPTDRDGIPLLAADFSFDGGTLRVTTTQEVVQRYMPTTDSNGNKTTRTERYRVTTWTGSEEWVSECDE